MILRKIAIGLAAFVALWGVPHFSFAHAQAERSQETGEILAHELFEQGLRAFESGTLSDACSFFERSLSLVERSGTRLNLAITELKLGRFERASADLDRISASADPVRDAELLARVAALQKELERLMAELTLDVTPVDATLELDGLPRAAHDGHWTMRLSPGRHAVLLARAGYATEHRELDFKAGVHESLRIQLNRLPEPALSPPGPRRDVDSHDLSQLHGLPERSLDAAAKQSSRDTVHRRRRWIGSSIAASVVVGAAVWVAVALAHANSGPGDENEGPVIPVGL